MRGELKQTFIVDRRSVVADPERSFGQPRPCGRHPLAARRAILFCSSSILWRVSGAAGPTKKEDAFRGFLLLVIESGGLCKRHN
jgi:hypothetical protein